MEEIKLSDDMLYNPETHQVSIRIPKKVATIKLCGGALTFDIEDNMCWQRPTDEQIKNLKEMFCIEVTPYEEN